MSSEKKETKKAETTSHYEAKDITVLEGLDPVRKRPGMYIGSTDTRGLHHLITEVVDNSVDEALAGYCTEITVTIERDGSVSVLDNGRGIPTGIHPTEKISAVQLVLTKLHAGGKFGKGGYTISGGLHGVGVSVVNALSEWLEVEVYQNGNIYHQTYNRGVPQAPLKVIGKSTKTGTKVTFYPDAEIFDTIEFNYETMKVRLRELAFLNKGLIIKCADLRPGREHKDTFCYKGGIKEFVESLNKGKDLIIPEIIHITKKNKTSEVDVAFQWNDGYSENIHAYANNINTEEGGVHLIGFRNALAKAINDCGKKLNLLKESDKLSIEDVLEGVVAIVSVKLENPQFEGQTKTKLGNAFMRGEVEKVVQEKFGEFLEENPKAAKELILKCQTARNAREAARRAKDLVHRKGVLENTTLPGKLADCTERDPKFCEIFIVEGDSAGGTAKQGRDRRFQAILPLRGKILNVEKARLARVLESETIKNMITAFGCGIQEDFDINRLRYHKIITMSDADVDGSHIRILLLTFLYRFMRPLIEGGYVYAAQPPLYKITKGSEELYAYSDAELEQIMGKGARGKANVQRYKGLGEMNAEQLWDTTMNPAHRTLVQITLEDAFAADEIFSTLMGEKAELRRDYIERNAANFTQDLDI